MDQTDDICVLCCRNISIYAVGICDHHVCYECSTRMRVLCKQNECPICRSDLPKVVFSQKKKTFNKLSEIVYPADKKYKIYFEDNYCRRAYERLLEHNCKICSHRCTFHTFGHLKNHMRREHELFFCELCVENLRIFTSERRCYTREELGRHRRIGDKNDTSHRGHPLCEFCDQRYVDRDELFRHLRREHYFCHFCDADGLANKFYSDYEYLRTHFRQQHYLCEEGSCREEKFTSAFRSEIDFKAHKAVQHSKNLSKAQAKQARTLELEFTIRPRNSQHNNSLSLSTDSRFRRQDRFENQSRSYQPITSRERNGTRNDSPEFGNDSSVLKSKPSLDTCSEEQFPCLSSAASASGHTSSKINNKTMANCLNKDINVKSSSSTVITGSKKTGPNDNDFPALRSVHLPGGQNPASASSEYVVSSARHPVNSQTHKTVLFHFNSQNSKKNPTRHATNVSIKVAKPKKLNVPFEDNHFNSKCNNEIPMQTLIRTESSKTEFSSGSSGDQNGAVGSVKRLVNRKINCDTLPPHKDTEEKKSKELFIPVTNAASERSNGEQIQPYITVKCKSRKKKSKTFNFLLESIPKELQCNGSNEEKDQSVTNEFNQEHSENKDKEESLNIMKDKKLNQSSDSETEELVKQAKSLIINDFPELPLQVDKKVSAPPGFVSNIVPPPGFASENSVQTNSVPTVNISLSSVAKHLMNFSSDDENEASLIPVQKQKDYNYIEPPDFPYRNIVLIQEIQKLLKSNETSFMEFKALSGQFRQCQISAKEYHTKCLEILGKDDFMKVISELLVLLPDIKKQQELLKVHSLFCRKQAENSGAVPKSNILSELENDFKFVVCEICMQVLWNEDLLSHQARHKDDSELVKNSN